MFCFRIPGPGPRPNSTKTKHCIIYRCCICCICVHIICFVIPGIYVLFVYSDFLKTFSVVQYIHPMGRRFQDMHAHGAIACCVSPTSGKHTFVLRDAFVLRPGDYARVRARKRVRELLNCCLSLSPATRDARNS